MPEEAHQMSALMNLSAVIALAVLSACAEGDYSPIRTNGNGGGNDAPGLHTGQTAEVIAEEVYGLDPELVGPIVSIAVGATGDGQEVGDEVVGEGMTQEDMGPQGDGTTNPPAIYDDEEEEVVSEPTNPPAVFE